MSGKNMKKGTAGKKGELVMSFTVAECGEFHCLGEYHEDIKTVEEAAALYRDIPKERMHGVPVVGIKLHKKGQPAYEDLQIDILSGRAIDRGILRYVPEAESSPLVQEAVGALIKMFPEKEIIDF